MDSVQSRISDSHPAPELVVLAGVVGSGKSTLSEAWQRVLPDWVRVNQDDLGDRRACETAVRTALAQRKNVVVDRQNFDKGQRRTWLEIAHEFPGVQVGGMVMGTSKEECRERLLRRTNHPTIGNPELAVQLLDKFTGLWEPPHVDEGFDQLIVLPPLPPAAEIDAALVQSLLATLHASPLNPSAASQRTPRPRTQHYVRPDGFVDDGSWRPPPFQPQFHGPIPPPQPGMFGGGYGYRPPPTATAWSSQPPNSSQGAYTPNAAYRHGPPPGSSAPHYQQPPAWRTPDSTHAHHQLASPRAAYATPSYRQHAGSLQRQSDPRPPGPAIQVGLPSSSGSFEQPDAQP